VLAILSGTLSIIGLAIVVMIVAQGRASVPVSRLLHGHDS
jgi:hypothetical protein